MTDKLNKIQEIQQTRQRIMFMNPREEFQTLYFDKLHLVAIDKCLRLHPDFKIEHSENEMMEFFDMRNKYVEGCLDKVFALHKIFDEEYLKYSQI
jgi:hypothetical protein